MTIRDLKRIEGRWVLLLPILSFVIGSWYFQSDRADLKVALERARESWRSGAYDEAIGAYLSLQSRYPNSEFAPDCLWEVATIYYYNLYDISNAMHFFERLITEYPQSREALDSHLKLAEIFNLELNELGSAIDHWEQALRGDLDPGTRREIEFKVADAHFRSGRFDEAFEEFEKIAASKGADLHTIEEARLRMAAILQLRKDYQGSIDKFQEVLGSNPCADCRLQAQLGLIESYEFLDRLPEAIETVKNISADDYPAERRQELLDRLLAKRKYYEPGLWDGH
ncbi:MAG: tetratricopeptide repeat protein [Acidobacteriota bacterium]